MTPTPARSEEVRAMFDGLDDDVVARIIETGASVDEISEALRMLNDEDPAFEPTSSRVVEVRSILADLLGDEDAEEGATQISI